MNAEMERRLLVDQYRSYVEICRQKDLLFEELDDEQISTLDNFDLRRITRQARDLARTPTEH